MSGAKGKRVKLSASEQVFMIVNHLIAIFFLIACLYPLWFVLIASFSDPTLVTSGKVFIWPKGFTIEGYKAILEEHNIWVGYKNTILYTVVGTAYNLCLTIPAAYALSVRELPFRRGFNLFFLITLFVGGGMIPTYLLINKLHLVNTFAVMVIPGGVGAWNLILCRNFFSTNIPVELKDATRIDGGSELRFFFQVALPLSKAILAVMLLFFAVGHWNSFRPALLYLRDQEKHPMQLVLRNLLLNTSVTNDYEDAYNMKRMMDMQSLKYGVIIVSSLPVLVMYPFIQKYFVKGVMVGSVKG